MNEQEKKRQRTYGLFNAETVYKVKKICLQKSSFSRKRRSGKLNKKRKEGFLISLATIKKDPTTSIRKHANEKEVHEKMWWQQIK